MRVLRRGELVDDDWRVIGDDEPVAPASIVSLARRLGAASDDAAVARAGVLLRPGDDVERLTLTPTPPMIAVDLGSATDGRGHSTARLLRRRGYRGELRALGDFGRDQVFFLARCGFDAFTVADGETARALAAGLTDFSLVYQPAADGLTPIARLRSG
jgi:uncharacterized protein (DUF934 family)